MRDFFIFIGALALALQAFIGLSFFISCIQEKEKRASLFGLFQFLVMTGVLMTYLLIAGAGFFHTALGLIVLIAGYILALVSGWFLMHKTEPNTKALQGTKGLMIGPVRYGKKPEPRLAPKWARFTPGSMNKE